MPQLKRYGLAIQTAIAVTLLLGIAGSWVVSAAMGRQAADRLRLDLERLTAEAAAVPPESRSAFVRSAAHLLDTRVTWIDPGGEVLADSDVAPEQLAGVANHKDRPEIKAALADGLGESRRRSNTVGESFLYVARRFGAGHVMRVALAERDLGRLSWDYRRDVILIGLLAGVLAGLAVAVTRRRHQKTVSFLSQALEELVSGKDAAGGSWDAELSVLKARLTDIAAKARENGRGDERTRLLSRIVFQELPEALLVVDASLHVLDANPAARKLFLSQHLVDPGVEAPARVPGVAPGLLELVRTGAVFAAFERALEGDRGADAAVTGLGEDGSDRKLEVVVRPIPRVEGEGPRAPGVPAAVGLIRDVTTREKTEAMRRQFVADVSHELRTPVASIRAASETLTAEEEVSVETRHFLAIIQRQARHLEELVADLTDLSQIETGAITMTYERRKARSVVEDVVRDLEPAAAARRVTVAVEIPPEVTVDGDVRRLSQVFRNLLDNAIKFSPEGGTVSIRGRSGPRGEAVLAFEDRGTGIPKAERERIFQRFYRVDPSRAKTVPGTGLGLAIVKHLLILHGGSIQVDSEVSRGSTFTVTLPRKLEATPAAA